MIFSPFCSQAQGHQPLTVFCSNRDTSLAAGCSRSCRVHFSGDLAGRSMRFRSMTRWPTHTRISSSSTHTRTHTSVNMFAIFPPGHYCRAVWHYLRELSSCSLTTCVSHNSIAQPILMKITSYSFYIYRCIHFCIFVFQIRLIGSKGSSHIREGGGSKISGIDEIVIMKDEQSWVDAID